MSVGIRAMTTESICNISEFSYCGKKSESVCFDTSWYVVGN